jgi:hypothetical protein
MNDGIDVKAVRGPYQVQKADRRRTQRYETFSAAERAAARLVGANPDTVFVVTQEVARITRWPKPTAPKSERNS